MRLKTDLPSEAKLAGPWPVYAHNRLCVYFRLPGLAIRGHNTLRTRAPSSIACARLCNERSFCNSFEYKCNGRCNVNEADILEPDLLDSWNTIGSWDYWQLKDCVAGAKEAVIATGLTVKALPEPMCERGGAGLLAEVLGTAISAEDDDENAEVRGARRSRGKAA